jgi:pimeloyl-ACP methyl ester carboxylesterase
MVDLQQYESVRERRTRTLSIRGVDYAINEWGDDGAPLIFYLHGWGDTGSTFQFVVDALQKGWHVVAPDWRGFGRTQYRSECYWFPDYLADLDALLNVYSDAQPVRIVGHSMGANVAALYAGTFPERVAALINIEGFGLQDSDPGQAPEHYRAWIEEGRKAAAFSHYPDFESLIVKIRARSPNITTERALFVATEWAHRDKSGSIQLRADPNHKRRNAILYRRAEAEACWAKISAHSLIVSGEDSSFDRMPGIGDPSVFPAAESCTIAGAGHMIHFEAPAALAREIDRFFSQPL